MKSMQNKDKRVSSPWGINKKHLLAEASEGGGLGERGSIWLTRRIWSSDKNPAQNKRENTFTSSYDMSLVKVTHNWSLQ